jgi:hypothetical protein
VALPVLKLAWRPRASKLKLVRVAFGWVMLTSRSAAS